MLSDRTATAIIYLVSAVWAANMILAMIPGTGYRPDPSVHAIFTSIVGTAFYIRYRAQEKEQDDKPGGGHKR